MNIVVAVQRHAKALETLARAERRYRDDKREYLRVVNVRAQTPTPHSEELVATERAAAAAVAKSHATVRRARTRQRNLQQAMKFPWEE